MKERKKSERKREFQIVIKNENKQVQVTEHFAMNLVSFLRNNQEIEF